MNNEEEILKCVQYCKGQIKNEERTFKKIKYLASGNEGSVSLYKPINWCFKVDEVAIKTQRFTRKEAIEFYEKLLEQQNKLEKSQDEKSSIIRIYELCQNQQMQLIIIMEKGGEDLFEYIKKNNGITDQRKTQICLQMAKAIKQLHQLMFLHRDIKPENFVFVKDDVKLIDFGLTKSNDEIQKSMDVGSRLFQAPEVLIGDGEYSFSIDIWSLGCTFYEVFANEALLKASSLNQAFNQITNHITNQKTIYDRIANLKIQQEWKDIIQNMLHPLSKDRINSEQLVLKIQSIIIQQNKQVFQPGQTKDRFCTLQSSVANNPQTNNLVQQKLVFQTIPVVPIIQNDKQLFQPVQTLNLNLNCQKPQQNFNAFTDPKTQQTVGQITVPQKFDANSKFNEVTDILFGKVQMLENELQNVKQDLLQIKKEVAELKDEKASLLDQNTKMKTQLIKQVQQQQTSINEFNKILNQAPQS